MRRTILKMGLAAAAVALVSGCASGVKHSEMAASMPGIKAGEGRVYFFRKAIMLGDGIQPQIHLNGQVVGRSRPNGFFYVDRPAGNYIASTSSETEKTLSFTLAPGETKYIRSSAGMGIIVYRINLDVETPAAAQAELAGLSYTGADASK